MSDAERNHSLNPGENARFDDIIMTIVNNRIDEYNSKSKALRARVVGLTDPTSNPAVMYRLGEVSIYRDLLAELSAALIFYNQPLPHFDQIQDFLAQEDNIVDLEARKFLLAKLACAMKATLAYGAGLFAASATQMGWSVAALEERVAESLADSATDPAPLEDNSEN